jgi:putative peptidoglycan lipid II flippase
LLAGSATLGVVLQAVVLYYFWRRIGLRYRPDFKFRGVGLGAAGKMASWTFGMLLLTTAAGIIETQVVSGASGKDASTAALGTAWLIFMLPHSIITVSVATAYFTRMSEHASRGDTVSLRTDASSAIRGTTLLIVLASAVIMVCSYPFAAVFVHESFAQTQALGNVIIAYLLGLVAFCVLFVVQRTFYALGDTRTPFFFTLFQVVLVVIGVLGCTLLPREWTAFGIALVVTLSGILQAVYAAWLLRRRLRGIDGRRILRSLSKYIAAVIVPVAAGVGVLVALGGTTDGGFAVSGIAQAIVSMVVIGLVMSGLYFGLLLLMRSQELHGFLAPLRSRFQR